MVVGSQVVHLPLARCPSIIQAPISFVFPTFPATYVFVYFVVNVQHLKLVFIPALIQAYYHWTLKNEHADNGYIEGAKIIID